MGMPSRLLEAWFLELVGPGCDFLRTGRANQIEVRDMFAGEFADGGTAECARVDVQIAIGGDHDHGMEEHTGFFGEGHTPQQVFDTFVDRPSGLQIGFGQCHASCPFSVNSSRKVRCISFRDNVAKA